MDDGVRRQHDAHGAVATVVARYTIAGQGANGVVDDRGGRGCDVVDRRCDTRSAAGEVEADLIVDTVLPPGCAVAKSVDWALRSMRFRGNASSR